ncbi:MAG: MFS transporter [Gammaproteobacteria bacterium]|nr:MFS transporter [Gammaproteobacteria bacterium]
MPSAAAKPAQGRAPREVVSAPARDGAAGALRHMPRGVWALGFVSLFMDVSSEMIHALLPVFLVSVLGASVTLVGLIEGVGEAVASMTKIFSGALSDKLGKRKLLAVAGYGLAAVTKPLFAVAPTAGWVFAARVTDRVGKGIRGAPRDALVAEIAPPAVRGAAFGLRQALDTVGAFAGPLLAILLMTATAGAFRTVFWIAVIPAVVSVTLLIVFVRDPPRTRGGSSAAYAFRAAVASLGAPYWWLIGVASLFTLARFSEAFLVLKASDAGLAAAWVPLVLVVMNVAYSASAYPAGFMSDRFDRWAVLGVGAALLIAGDVVLALGESVGVALAGIALWGLHMGFTQGLFAALVADVSGEPTRGTAFGVFNFVTGLVLLAASVLAGWLWDHYGAQATFMAGALLTAAALIATAVLHATGRLKPRAREPAPRPDGP